MKKKYDKNTKESRASGMAMLITLAVVTVLVTVTVALNRESREHLKSAAVIRDRITLDETARLGVHAATAVLLKDRAESRIDSIQEGWANPEYINVLISALPVGDAELNVSITDELSRIQVNALVTYPKGRNFNPSQKRLWERLLRVLFADMTDYGEEEIPVIVNSLKDWLDFGDDDAVTGLSGAESDYYESLDPPYIPGNGPFTHINELIKVKGIDPLLFHGMNEQIGFSQFLTVHGAAQKGNDFTFPGKININTASLPVITGLLKPEDADMAEAIFEYRKALAVEGEHTYLNDLTSATWYKNVPGGRDLRIDPALITTASDLFRVESTARTDHMTRRIMVVMRRSRPKGSGVWRCEPIFWRTN